ncbi:MAG: hypothetical protein JO182_13600 [Acidobacteriaceae bacterium]|nr:hypothetical protein [Acidobacteriaceae bacterium]
MKYLHTPRVDARYWTAITLASVFGTNLGDFYAHESGLGIVAGLAVLALLAAIVFVGEHFDGRRHEAYYWLVIMLIRTGATNIADYLAFRVRAPPVALTLSLIALLCLFGWNTHRATRADSGSSRVLPKTDAAYWLAMLTAGVFGTVVGDLCEHAIGEGIASVGLTALLLGVLLAGRGRAAQINRIVLDHGGHGAHGWHGHRRLAGREQTSAYWLASLHTFDRTRVRGRPGLLAKSCPGIASFRRVGRKSCLAETNRCLKAFANFVFSSGSDVVVGNLANRGIAK